MWNSVTVSLITLGAIVTGIFGGETLRRVLPDVHLTSGSKDAIRLGSALIATLAALVMGLLITTAKGSYEGQYTQIRQLTANIILVDRLLEQYGPEAHESRELLRRAIKPLIERIWKKDAEPANQSAAFEFNQTGEIFFTSLASLTPANESQRSYKERAIGIGVEMARIRLMLFVQADAKVPGPFLVILVFWLATLFATFALFSPLNATVSITLCIFAVSASCAIFLILEMEQPFSGIMQISDSLLRNALGPLAPR
jgi:hypothetical protein